MNKTIKIIAIAVAALLALLIAAAGIIAATFDPNHYKPQLIRLVQEKQQRTLTIPGEIKLRFFPKIGADLGKLSISERNSSAEFAAVDSAKLSLALIPLLKKQFVVDRVEIEGLRANIRRGKDGHSNYDDLVTGEKPEAAEEKQPQGEVKLDIDSVHIGNAHLTYDDQQTGRKFDIDKLNLDTGKIANGVPSKVSLTADIKGNPPDVNAHVALNTGFTLDFDQKHYVLKGMDAEIKGALAGFTDLVVKLAGDADLKPEAKRIALDGIKLSASGKRPAEGSEQRIDAKFDIPNLAVTDTKVTGGKLAGEAKLTQGERNIVANFSAPSFEGSPQAFKLPALALDATIRDSKLDAKAKLSGALSGDIDKLLFTSPQLALTLAGKQGDTALNGSLTTPLSANLKTKLIELPQLAADFTLPNPGGGTLKLKAGGNASANLDKKNASAALKGNLDQSAFDAKLGVSDFSPMTYTFDIGIDQIDLDRYRSKSAAGAGKPPAKAEGKAAAAEQPMDFSALKGLHANGNVRIGALKVANIKSSNVRVALRAAGGKLDVNPLNANLYGGSVAGALSVTADKPPHFAVRQHLAGIHIGPLLQDAMGKAPPIEGTGNVQLDVTASGATVSQIKKGLNGSARMELRDGAIRGVNIAKAVREAKAKIGEFRGTAAPQAGTASADEKTDFSEMSASFRIANGVARNDDLDAKSPLVRIGGSGDINLGADRLDYLAKVTVVSTLKGQGGPELQALKGLTVPVKLSGPFTAIAWHVDFAGLASELAKQKLEGKEEELKAKAQEKLQERLKGLLGK